MMFRWSSSRETRGTGSSLPFDWSKWNHASEPSAAFLRHVGSKGAVKFLESIDVSLNGYSFDDLGVIVEVTAKALDGGMPAASVVKNVGNIGADEPSVFSLVNTLMAWAMTERSFADYQRNGVRRVAWLDAGKTSCAVCQANKHSKMVKAGELFPSGHHGPPAHLDCRCAISSGRD